MVPGAEESVLSLTKLLNKPQTDLNALHLEAIQALAED